MSGRFRGRLGWAVVTSVAVVASGGAVAQARPQAAAPVAASAPACAEVAADAAAAAALAARCDTEVEVTGARTEWATTVALPDGSMRLDVSTGAVRTDVSGQWAPVDTALADTGGAIEVASPVTPMSFSDGSGEEPFATIERDGHTLTFDVPFDLPAPDVDGSQLTYVDVLPGVDLVVTVNDDATGFSEVLRVESPEAAAHPDLADLTFPVTTSDGIEVQAQDGGFVAAAPDGAPVFTSPVPVMWDSSSDVADGTTDRALGTVEDADPTVAPVGDETVAAIPAEVAPGAVTVTPDEAMLADPDTEWPVYIDPGVSGSLNQRSAVRTVIGNAYNFPGDEGVGLCQHSTCSHLFKSRLLYQFVGLDAVGAVDPADVRGATFSVTGTHSYSCTPQPVTLHAVADFNASTPYPGGSYWKPLQTHTIAHRSGCTNGQVPRRIEFDATVAAQDVAAANQGHASFGIAVDESSMAYWKRYGWDAGISVTYNRAPSAPTALGVHRSDVCVTGDARPWVNTKRPRLRAVVSDPDGGNVHADFVLVSAVNPAHVVWDPAPTPAQGSGALHQIDVPADLNESGLYQWRVRGIDGDGRAGPEATCEFGVDTTPPGVPGVTAIPGQPALYAAGPKPAGGIGQAGLVTFDSGGSTDVTAYRYGLNTSDPQSPVPARTATVRIVPTLDGPQTLNVVAVDRAGNVSPRRDHRFTVDIAALGSAWRLDEATPGTATDVLTVAPNPLAVSASTTVVGGLLADMGRDPSDRALRFDADTDTATSARPVIAGGGAFSVSALVKLDDVSQPATVVSQDGTQVSGFELGLQTGDACPGEGDTDKPCWSFAMRGGDADSSALVAVRSTRPVTAGKWAQITGVRGGDGQLKIFVCDLSTPDDTRTLTVHSAPTVAAPPAWLATGPLRLGHGREKGAGVRHMTGTVGEVRTYTGEVTLAHLRNSCQAPGSMPVGPTNPATPERRNAQGSDFDADGKADVFWSNPADGHWRMSFAGTTPWAVVNYAGAIPTSRFQFGDIDGDKRDDVFLVDNGRWLVSDGGVSGWRHVGGDPNAGTDVALADFNGDGKDDVFWSRQEDGKWRISHAGATAWEIVGAAGPFKTDRFRFGDFNGDGKDDVFMVHPDNGYWIWSSEARSGWQQLNTPQGVPVEQLKIADLDGDGKDDVFRADAGDGNWYVSYGGTTPWVRINNAGPYGTDAFQLADMDGDGGADVFFVNPADGRWLYSRSGTAGWAPLNRDLYSLADRPRVR